MTDSNTENNKNNNRKYVVAIVLLALLSIALGVFVFTGQQKVEKKTETISQLEVDKLELQNDLQDMLIQYDTVTTQNEKLEAEINAQEEQIKEMLKQIEKHKDDAYIIHKLKEEASTLRTIMKGYLATIDSLNTVNKGLRAEKETLNQELTQVRTRAEELESEKKNLAEKVKTGSILNASEMTAIGIKIRNNGAQKEVSRANKTEMIKACATIAENKIAETGRKVLYMRIITPDGVVLDDGMGEPKTFKFEGVTGKYSVKRQFQFDGSASEICIFYTVNSDSELPSGQYIVQLYENGAEIGKTTFDLR